MGVVFKGGSSGRPGQDYAAPTPNSGPAQPVLDTSTSGATPDTVTFKAEEYKQAHFEHQHAPFLPTGGTIPESSTDIEDPGATTGGWGPGVRFGTSK